MMKSLKKIFPIKVPSSFFVLYRISICTKMYGFHLKKNQVDLQSILKAAKK